MLKKMLKMRKYLKFMKDELKFVTTNLEKMITYTLTDDDLNSIKQKMFTYKWSCYLINIFYIVFKA